MDIYYIHRKYGWRKEICGISKLCIVIQQINGQPKMKMQFGVFNEAILSSVQNACIE